jgi:hypothetical protein
MPEHESIELWFPIPDLAPLVEHCMAARSLQPDPRYGAQPVLHLIAQGVLFYLSTNAHPPLLVDAFNPNSRQRVYAVGHSYHVPGVSLPADPRHGTPHYRGSLPLITGHRDAILGQLVDRLRRASRIGDQWLVVTIDPDGRLQWEVCPLPHPAPAAKWRDVRVEMFGLRGSWPGQVLTNDTRRGFLLPRFVPDVARQLVATLGAAPHLPRQVAPVVVSDAPDTGDPHQVGPDDDGFYRVGPGWPWVSLDLLPPGRLLPHLSPPPPGIDPTALPAHGQDTYTAMGYVMWLDDSGQLALRAVYDTGVDLCEPVGQPEYGDVDPEVGWQLRAVEHALRLAGAARVTVTGLAARFTPAQIEALLITAAHAVQEGTETLSVSQRDLAARVYALLNPHH